MRTPASPAIEVHGLGKRFGDVIALDGLDLEVEAGTVFGLLGPNGAGKTTLVRILATLLQPTAGRAAVLGRDVVGEPLAVRRRIGLAGQLAAVDEELTGRENIEMIGRLYRLPAGEARRRADELLERFALVDAAERRVATYSGGMRRRLDLAAGLIGRPHVVLLDEPSTGLDPRSRQELWSIVEELRHEGTTVLLTTQYLEEADRLAQRIAVVDHGRIAAQGTSAQLKATIGGNVVSVRLADPSDIPSARAALASLAAGEQPHVDSERERVSGEIRLAVADPAVSAEVVRRLDAQRLSIAAVELHQPSLDDVFLALTGRPSDEKPSEHTPVEEAA
ncbi:MAG: ATP-binding cassette domain-containing protein [Solirubrobacteraceae bacterium]